MLNRVFRAHHSAPVIALLASAMLALCALLDLSGRITGESWLWVTGGRILPLAVVAALAGGVAALLHRPRRGAVLLIMAALLASLARWLRGSAGVPPDPPLLGAEFVSLVLAAFGSWRSGKRDL